MLEISVTALSNELQNLYEVLEQMGATNGIGPNSHRALGQASLVIETIWQEKLKGMKMRDSSEIPVASLIHRKKVAANSVQVVAQLPPLGGYQDSIKWMAEQEKPWDMKQDLPYGQKSRLSSTKTPYLIVPLRKKLSAMPSYVAKVVSAKDFEKSIVKTSATTSAKASPNSKGALINRAIYNWGSRFQDRESGSSVFDGLVRMQTNAGAKPSSNYLTFRAVSPNSKGWVRKARGVVLPQVSREASEQIEQLFFKAFKADVGV